MATILDAIMIFPKRSMMPGWHHAVSEKAWSSILETTMGKDKYRLRLPSDPLMLIYIYIYILECCYMYVYKCIELSVYICVSRNF